MSKPHTKGMHSNHNTNVFTNVQRNTSVQITYSERTATLLFRIRSVFTLFVYLPVIYLSSVHYLTAQSDLSLSTFHGGKYTKGSGRDLNWSNIPSVNWKDWANPWKRPSQESCPSGSNQAASAYEDLPPRSVDWYGNDTWLPGYARLGSINRTPGETRKATISHIISIAD